MVGYTPSEGTKLNQLDYMIAGAGSGCITRMLCQPLDVLKIRFQLQVEPIAEVQVSKYKSLFHATSLILKEEGVKAFWKGHIPAQLLSISYGIAQFWVFEILTQEASKLNLSSNFSPVINFTCGAFAGCSATVASFPFDVVRTRLVAQNENRKIYTGVLNGFKLIVKNEGFFTLYRGLLPTMIQIAPQGGLQFMCYKFFDNMYKYMVNAQNTTLVSSLFSGSMAGLCAKTAVYPFDLAKKRLQIQGFERGRVDFGKFFSCRGLTDCMIRIYQVEGFLGLFKGLNPSLLKAMFTTAFHFSAYEMICKFLQKKN